VTDWRERLSDEERRTIRRRAVPDWTEPMLATLSEAPRFVGLRGDKPARDVVREEPV
jgi:hypothetical protein